LPAGVTFDEDANNPDWEEVPGKPNTYRFPIGQLLANDQDSLPIVTTVNEEAEGGPVDGTNLDAVANFTADNASGFNVSSDTGQNVVVEGDDLTPTELPDQAEPSRLMRIFLPFIGR